MTIHRLALPETAFTRLTERQRIANQAEERAEALRIARKALRSADRYEDQIIRDACSVLETYGDGMDYLLADQAIRALNLRERQRAHKATLEAALTAEAEEAPVKVAMRYRPELLDVGKGLMLAVLVAVAFNVAVLS
jgi:hypothetical protein